jgi:hypothetical protein
VHAVAFVAALRLALLRGHVLTEPAIVGIFRIDVQTDDMKTACRATRSADAVLVFDVGLWIK